MDYMELALKLARKAKPSPNPRVGAVIVKDGKIIGQGYHKAAGTDHAEIAAIKNVKEKSLLAGSALYVTLEPCSHEDKRTPPCTKAITEAGITRVVVGSEDENPKVRGIEELRQAGIGLELAASEPCRELNEAFFHWIKTSRPFVLVKLAMTLDGRIAAKSGDSKYISNAQSRSVSYAWRAVYDAIMVGLNTVIIDNPRLTARTPGAANPVRVIVDSKLKIPLTSRVLESNARRIIATTKNHDAKKKVQLEAMGVEVLVLPEEKPEHVDLNALMVELGKIQITSIIVEGGSELATDFLEHKLINKGAFFIAAKILGAGKNAFAGQGVDKMDDAFQLKRVSIRKLGDDVLFQGYF